LNGGWDKYKIPQYQEPVNNPMRTNEQKRIYNENKTKTYPNNNKNQILNLQLYQPSKPKPKKGTLPNPSVFYPNYVPNPFDPIGYGNYLNHTRYNTQMPVYKEYNININGISGSHVRTAMLYEDILPAKSTATSFTTVGERVNMYESMRAMLFSNGDGYDIPVDTSAYNILSHIKLMDINPYNASKYSHNPYKGLPYGFILYRSCYPIRHDSRNSTAQCSRNSMGVNVRVYRLTEGCYLINKQEKSNISKYDVWRDIAFYNYIKEEILKKKMCPNFALMYGYNIALESRIDYENIMLKANKHINKHEIPANTAISLANNIDKIDMRPTLRVTRNPQTGEVKQEWKHPKINPLMRKLAEATKLNEYKGKSLVCLTEAPNYSIIGWAKKEYRQEGNIKRMINPGYHPPRVWRSIIFQLFAALYTMQLKKIVINDFSLERNVFIKDIDTGGSVTNYWKYVIDGIEYYIPNYGYLLLIDSNYRDFDKDYDEQETEMREEKRKINGNFISMCSLSADECDKKVFEMLKQAMDTNNFGQDFLNDNGAKLPDEIYNYLSMIGRELDADTNIDISYYIRKFMSKYYIHNRIGKLLKETEIKHIKTNGVKEFRKGQIIVYTEAEDTKKFVLYITGINESQARILTSDSIEPNNYNIIELDVNLTLLNEYSIVEPINQDFDIETSNLNEEKLLEKYVLAL
jgi:hypothetical protein